MDRLKTFRNTAVALACTLLAFSCSNDEDSGTLPAGEHPMTFSGSVEQQLTRSSSANSWDGGEEVAIETDGTIKKYTAAVDDKLTVASGVEPFYWQTQTDMKTVEAWYPYNATTPSSWSVQADQSSTGYQQSDFLYAPATSINYADRNTAKLNFYHQTAKVVINIIDGYAATNPVTVSSVKIGDANNLALSGDYAAPAGTNVKVGTWTNLQTMGTITPREQTLAGTYLKSYAALVIPQDMTGKKFIAVTLSNGNTYYYTPTGTAAALEGGKQYNYEVTVKNTGITVSTGDISGWEETTNPPTEGGAGIWKVGDYYPDPNVDLSNTAEKAKIKGVVFWVDPSDSRHGKVVGLSQNSSVQWATSNSTTNATNTANGRANMKTIKGINSDFNGFPVFKWVHEKNDAGQTYSDANATGVWYLPAKDELQYLLCAAAGKSPATWNSSLPPFNSGGNHLDKAAFNGKLTAAGGDGFENSYYWSSSENVGSLAWHVSFYSGYTDWGNKYLNVRARCVLAF